MEPCDNMKWQSCISVCAEGTTLTFEGETFSLAHSKTDVSHFFKAQPKKRSKTCKLSDHGKWQMPYIFRHFGEKAHSEPGRRHFWHLLQRPSVQKIIKNLNLKHIII